MTAKIIPELKFKYCPFCFAEMVFNSDTQAYDCPNKSCRTEVWHDPLGRAEPVRKQNPGLEYICRSLVSDVHGGSSSGKKYGAKDKMRKPTTHQIYEKLCSE